MGQIQINQQAICMILQRLVEISKQDIEKHRRMLGNYYSKSAHYKKQYRYRMREIERNFVDGYLFLEWAKENL